MHVLARRVILFAAKKKTHTVKFPAGCTVNTSKWLPVPLPKIFMGARRTVAGITS